MSGQDTHSETVRTRGQQSLADALSPFGWTCTDTFWQRYYTDPWVFNLANAVERLTEEIERLRSDTPPSPSPGRDA